MSYDEAGRGDHVGTAAPAWSRAEKERIVAASLEPGAVASEVGPGGRGPFQPFVPVAPAALRKTAAAPGFSAVTVASETGSGVSGGLIEIELASGARLRISGAADAALVSVVMGCLVKGTSL